MNVLPLRNMVLVRPADLVSGSKLHVIAPERLICPFCVVACGPEVRDVEVGQTVFANRLTATAIGDQFLLPDTAILGTL